MSLGQFIWGMISAVYSLQCTVTARTLQVILCFVHTSTNESSESWVAWNNISVRLKLDSTRVLGECFHVLYSPTVPSLLSMPQTLISCLCVMRSREMVTLETFNSTVSSQYQRMSFFLWKMFQSENIPRVV